MGQVPPEATPRTELGQLKGGPDLVEQCRNFGIKWGQPEDSAG